MAGIEDGQGASEEAGVQLQEKRHEDLLAGRAATLSFRKVNYMVEVKAQDPAHPERKQKIVVPRFLLKDVSGIVEPGELLCVMGPTGSGKTTLLDTLAGKVAADKDHLYGDILINGKPRDKTFKRLAGFVPQFEALTSTMTVEETFFYSAQLNLPSSVSKDEKRKMVEKVLSQLGLTDERKTKIGGALIPGLSGGQKKRAAIGCELITLPQLLFLDEPTTGLDASAAVTVMSRITQVAKDGQTVICTIHQPSPEIFSRFDKLVLLSRGQVLYFGPAQGAISFFASVDLPVPDKANPADFFLDCTNTDFDGSADINMIRSKFDESQYAVEISQRQDESQAWFDQNRAEMDKKSRAVFESTWFGQFWVLLQRNFLNLLRNPTNVWARLILYLGMGLFVGSLYFDLDRNSSTIMDRAGILFFVAAFLVFMTLSMLPAFIEERAVFVRERQNGAYRVSAYHLASSIAALPFTFVLTLLTSVALYFMVNLKSGAEPFFKFVFLLFLALYCGESVVVMLSGIFSEFMLGLAGAAGIFGFFMTVCGFFQTRSNQPNYLGWTWNIGFHSFALRSFMYNEFNGESFPIPGTGTSISGNAILDRFDIKENTFGLDVGVLLINIVAYRFFFYLALRFLQRGKR